MRILVLIYGLATYLIFFATFLYLIGFVVNMVVPKGVDDGTAAGSLGEALLVNLSCILLFGVQHTIMARPAFKRWWTRIIPEAAERSTFVLVTSGILILTFWQWRPLDGVIWSVEHPGLAMSLQVLGLLGWGLALLSTFVIDHFDLFGLRQVILFARGKPYTAVEMKENMLYRLVRHPLMLGFIVAFWSTPHMTVGHLVFAGAFTGYILIAVKIEERDLLRAHSGYADYRRRVPSILPLPRRREAAAGSVSMVN
ncbi:MAG: methanethiol S-methyltransferase [Planctomycetota bacterium]|jgi:protein-S-isoprenylcysteine O-methyltransferase Ste14